MHFLVGIYNLVVTVCFLLHFYQPSNQFAEIVRKVAHDCYVPLIKAIKDDKRIKLTANFPLSLLAQLDSYGFAWLIRDVKELVAAGRIELVGSAAYHPILTKVPMDFVEKQIVLNEMALGYYFGSTKDFEGEPCYMVKNVQGFFPPEMAVNSSLLAKLRELGYDWAAVDEYSLPKELVKPFKGGVCYMPDGIKLRLIVRNRELTNMISFKRDLDQSQITAEILRGGTDKVIALDAETFGHHYRDGVELFESIVSDIYANGGTTSTLSAAYESAECRSIDSVRESTWSSDYETTYPLWENQANPINSLLWELFREVHAEYQKDLEQDASKSLMPVLPGTPIWQGGNSSKLELELAMLKLEQSDQFWWSTGVELMGRKNYNRYMIESALDYYKLVAGCCKSNKLLLAKIAKLLESLI
ncbi:MAG: hypothetical protein UW82_C0033G0004 [candidate division WWE3 bacterium GW2011_GWC2_44_9]|uniref:Glycoside hydrolase family 57 N-terminal domain-containing protein n=1 Tax=candidate division WWE3 bacterium GW2011_GWC2_44_9 TaxID=1619125 RepID=A0A0G1KJM8_UNCKA|nr:MAG: hypothetical protein UW82_C0033G0004 [candidate division WWE3 bacterium GW2011_GWC2_44_9]